MFLSAIYSVPQIEIWDVTGLYKDVIFTSFGCVVSITLVPSFISIVRGYVKSMNRERKGMYRVSDRWTGFHDGIRRSESSVIESGDRVQQRSGSNSVKLTRATRVSHQSAQSPSPSPTHTNTRHQSPEARRVAGAAKNNPIKMWRSAPKLDSALSARSPN